MKWLSPSVAQVLKRLLFASALGLVILGLITANGRTLPSFAVIFLLFTGLLLTVLYWNLFDDSAAGKKTSQASPGVVGMDFKAENDYYVDVNQETSIPNPMDSDYEIPLM
tara:strand:+ start:911 stop:1240 length:330 start_codon:yes stop_codon:yes gene_type:complete